MVDLEQGVVGEHLVRWFKLRDLARMSITRS